jgi:hypothetical protein
LPEVQHTERVACRDLPNRRGGLAMAPVARKLTVSSLALSLLVVVFSVGTATADGPPPKNLRLEGDHWTAWDPPDEYPEGTEIYIIQRGDTLWDLAAADLGDPYLWPQLWERNQYILDAHWIYPGDPLVMSVDVVPVETLAESTGEAPEPAGAEEEKRPFGRWSEAPSPLGSATDIYCSGFIGAEDQEFPYQIVGSEAMALAPAVFGESYTKPIRTKYGIVNTTRNDLATSDIVYLDGGRNGGLEAGALFMMVQVKDIVHHPVTHKKVGRFYRYLGLVRVLSVQEDTAIAEITESCNPAQVGAVLMPFVPEPVPLGRRSPMRPVNVPAANEVLADSAAIIHVDFGYVSLGEGNVVFIDRGEVDDVTPGDIYTIYRMNSPGLPAVVMGELAVLSVGEETSMGRILKSRYTVRVGDRLDPK